MDWAEYRKTISTEYRWLKANNKLSGMKWNEFMKIKAEEYRRMKSEPKIVISSPPRRFGSPIAEPIEIDIYPRYSGRATS